MRSHHGVAVAASNRSAILALQGEDVEAVLLRVSSAQVVVPVTKMPWGNTCALLQDPDGNLVNIFSKPSQVRQMAAR
ncbi:VOC family protein [Pseudomonas sp. 1152_12]|uniref:VOC family protein n=1 Tax=Pseudomonas sp. 1152_12 TaxID=2604455 RepID=UPI0040649694